MINGRMISRVNLLRVVAAASNLLHDFVRQVSYHLQDVRIGAKEMIADVLSV